MVLLWWLLLGIVLGKEDDNLIAVTDAVNTLSCAPVYGKGWLIPQKRPGKVDIRVIGEDASPKHPISVVVYEYGDDGGVGKEGEYFCTEELKGKGVCMEVGKAIFTGNKQPVMGRQILGAGPTLDDKQVTLEYPVSVTGYYCVRVVNPGQGVVQVYGHFVNPFGELPAEFFPLRQAHLLLALTYGAMAVVWAALLWRYRQGVMRLQHYMSSVIGLCWLESMVNFAFYSHFNEHGAPSHGLLVICAMVGAIRTTASLFLLLLVALGYGVVIPSLGEKAWAIYTLTGAHLVASLLAILVASTSLNHRAGAIAFLLTTIPISATYAALLSWILTALRMTKEALALRKQTAKLAMYHSLTVCLSILTLLALLLLPLSVLVILGRYPGQAWYAAHWGSLWWWTDGWQLLLHLVGVSLFAWIFRPREHNRSYDLEEIGGEPIEMDLERAVQRCNSNSEDSYTAVANSDQSDQDRRNHTAPSRDSLADPWKPH